jgi:DNA-binding MarR family transcriptional regulator
LRSPPLSSSGTIQPIVHLIAEFSMPKPKPDAQADVFRAVNALRRMVRGLRSSAESVERDLRISAAQLFVLSELSQRPDQSVKDLAARTMTTHSTVSEVVGQLIAKDLVARTADASDGRRAMLRLTRQGGALLKKSPRAIQEDLIEGFATLRPAARRALANGLEKWLAASGLGEVPPSMLFEKPANQKSPSHRPK